MKKTFLTSPACIQLSNPLHFQSTYSVQNGQLYALRFRSLAPNVPAALRSVACVAPAASDIAQNRMLGAGIIDNNLLLYLLTIISLVYSQIFHLLPNQSIFHYIWDLP